MDGEGSEDSGRPADVAWDKTLQSWDPIVVLLLAGAGAAGGVLLLLIGWDWTPESVRFVKSPGFLAWAAVVAAQSAYWAVVTVPLWREVVATYRSTRPALAILVIPAAISIVLVALVALSPAGDLDWPLYGHQPKVAVLTVAAGAGVGIPAVFGICLVQDRVRRHRPAALTEGDVLLAVAGREQMRRFLGAAGAVIGLAVLASGALRGAAVPVFVKEAELPATAVLLYGAFFTGLLVAVYVPAHLSLRRLCLDLRERYFPFSAMPAPDDAAGFKAWVDGRAQLDALTGVDVTTAQQLQASLFILAPLISGVLGALVR